MKTDFLRQREGRCVITSATATPIANSVTEMYVMQRYLRPDLLQAAGIKDFNTWAATFGQVVEEMGLSVARSDRFKLEHLGGTVASFDPVMGRYDLAVTAELPAHASAVALSHIMNAGGLYPEVLQAFSIAEMEDAHAKASELAETIGPKTPSNENEQEHQ